MPTWLAPTLKWGGIALAVISAVAIIYVQYIAAAPTPEAGAAADGAPLTLYWGLLVVGIAAAIGGFALGRPKRPT
jgi:hypothetical protein